MERLLAFECFVSSKKCCRSRVEWAIPNLIVITHYILLPHLTASYSILVSDPEYVRLIVTGPADHFPKGHLYKHLGLLPGGLFTTNGEKWRRDRRILNPNFQFQALKSMMKSFNEHTDEFIECLTTTISERRRKEEEDRRREEKHGGMEESVGINRRIEQESAGDDDKSSSSSSSTTFKESSVNNSSIKQRGGGLDVDMASALSRITLDIICAAGFDYNLHSVRYIISSSSSSDDARHDQHHYHDEEWKEEDNQEIGYTDGTDEKNAYGKDVRREKERDVVW